MSSTRETHPTLLDKGELQLLLILQGLPALAGTPVLLASDVQQAEDLVRASEKLEKHQIVVMGRNGRATVREDVQRRLQAVARGQPVSYTRIATPELEASGIAYEDFGRSFVHAQNGRSIHVLKECPEVALEDLLNHASSLLSQIPTFLNAQENVTDAVLRIDLAWAAGQGHGDGFAHHLSLFFKYDHSWSLGVRRQGQDHFGALPEGRWPEADEILGNAVSILSPVYELAPAGVPLPEDTTA